MAFPSNWTTATREYWVAIVVLFAGMILSGAFALHLWRESQSLDEQRFALAVEESVQRMETAMESVQSGLQLLADAVGAREEFTEGHWRLQVDRLSWNIDYPGVLEVGLAKVAQPEWPTEFEGVGLDDFRSTNATVRRRASQALNFLRNQPVECVSLFRYFPRRGSRPPASPVALVDDPRVIRLAMIRQWPRMTGKQVIAQETNGAPLLGTIMILGVPTEAMAQRWTRKATSSQSARDRIGHNEVWDRMNAYLKQRWGNAFVYASVDWQTLYEHSGSLMDPNLDLELFASRASNPAAIVASHGKHGAETSRYATNVFVRVYGDRWKLSARSTPSFETQSTGYRSWIALGGGLSLSLLVAALLWVQIGARLRQEKISKALAAAREERIRLDRDLHDGAIQTLYALQLGFNQLERDIAEHPQALQRVGNVRQTLQSVIAELRGFLVRQAPESTTACSLENVIHSMVRVLKQGLPSGTTLDVSCEPGTDDLLTKEQLVELAIIAREAVSNSLRHAQAQRIEISTRRRADTFELEIRDDGEGFDPMTSMDRGHGLASMSTRAKDLCGTFEAMSRPGAGTTIRVTIHLNEPTRSNSHRR